MSSATVSSGQVTHGAGKTNHKTHCLFSLVRPSRVGRTSSVHRQGEIVMQERNAWVDYAKAIGIILVVYGHVARGVFNAGLPMDEELFVLVDSIIYSFHMPLFFFLSGLFFYDSLMKRGTGGLIVNKVDTIVYPFIVWSLLQGFFEVALSNYTNGQVTVT